MPPSLPIFGHSIRMAGSISWLYCVKLRQGAVVEVEKWPCLLFGSTRHFFAVYYLEAYSVQFVSPANEPRNVFNCKELSQN